MFTLSPTPMIEVAHYAYPSLVELFGADKLSEFREKFHNDCMELAWSVKNMLNTKGFLAEVITFKNGNAFADGGILIDADHSYLYHTVVLMGEWVIDILHTDKVIKTKDYILGLQEYNPKLRIDYSMSSCWYTDAGFPYRPSLEDLIKYKY